MNKRSSLKITTLKKERDPVKVQLNVAKPSLFAQRLQANITGWSSVGSGSNGKYPLQSSGFCVIYNCAANLINEGIFLISYEHVTSELKVM